MEFLKNLNLVLKTDDFDESSVFFFITTLKK